MNICRSSSLVDDGLLVPAVDFPSPREWSPDELRVGLTAEFDREIGEADVLDFARVSGDYNPLHVNADYARATNYGGRIVHGAFQVGLASALMGMHLPGLRVLFGSANARFPAPLFYPSRVNVRGEIIAWNAQNSAGILRVVVSNVATHIVTADITVGFALHEVGGNAPSSLPRTSSVASEFDGTKPLILLTGAAGGIGTELVRALAGRYSVLALINRQPLNEELRALPDVHELHVDLNSAGWEDALDVAVAGRELYGVVHAAWPGLPQGGLLGATSEAMQLQLAFGTTYLVALARLLFARAGTGGGRLVAIGSTAGVQRPVLSMGAYSLGKAALESTVRLLAPEMARRHITVNAVNPSFVATGLNGHATERQRKLEMARVPLGRLCEPEDVAGMVLYLLSADAVFVSGQVMTLSGGQL